MPTRIRVEVVEFAGIGFTGFAVEVGAQGSGSVIGSQKNSPTAQYRGADLAEGRVPALLPLINMKQITCQRVVEILLFIAFASGETARAQLIS
jgi:hypothetical protein